MKILLIIPCYNEEANVKGVFDAICSYNALHEQKYDMLFVNDGSTDRTGELLHKYGINYVSLIKNLGIGGGVQTGYKYALSKGYDIAVQVDGDGQHDVESIEQLLSPIISREADMVIGSRFVGASSKGFKSSFMRRIGIKVISFIIWIRTGKKILDTTSGFRAVGTGLIKKFAHDYPEEYPEPISTVAALNGGYRCLELPAEMRERCGGISSIRSWKTVYYMINVVLSILLASEKTRNEGDCP